MITCETNTHGWRGVELAGRTKPQRDPHERKMQRLKVSQKLIINYSLYNESSFIQSEILNTGCARPWGQSGKPDTQNF